MNPRPHLFPAPPPIPAVSPAWFRRLVAAALLLTLVVVMFGAYVRLTDAGLGCPDWPGCYGQISPAQARDQIAQAVAEQGGEHGPVSMGKAWREMLHRYLAKTLGLLIIVIAIAAWLRRERMHQPVGLPFVLLAVVVFQGLLGMWTVTLLLKPAIVSLHLLGGMLTLALLVWLWMRQRPQLRYVDAEPTVSLGAWAMLALAVTAVQIALGGWVSTNYAALACPDFPTCQGVWWPETNFGDAFHVLRELGQDAEGQMLPASALTAIHLVHRLGAVVTLVVVGALGLAAVRREGVQALGAALVAVVLLQFALGIANVLAGLPLALAVAHNGVAAVLLVLLVMLNFRIHRARLQV